MKDNIKHLEKKLENTLEIIMEHFHESEERIEALEEKNEELENEIVRLNSVIQVFVDK